MSYKKQNFTNGQILKAEHLNHIEDGVLNSLEQNAIVCTKSGEVVSITDASNQPFYGLSIYGKTTQDGTPTPENPVELKNAVVSTISIVGTNFLPYPHASTSKVQGGITFTDNGDGTVTVNGTATERVIYYVTYGDFARALELKAGVTYHLSGCPNGGSTSSYFLSLTEFTNESSMKAVYDYGSGTNWLTRSECRYAVKIEVLSGVTISNLTFKPMLNKGTTALPYEPYKGGTATLAQPVTLSGIPVSSGGNYTDANGQQWVCDEMDFARGVYVQRVGKVDMGTLGWTYSGGILLARVSGMLENSRVLCPKYKGASSVYNLLNYPPLILAFCSHWADCVNVNDTTYTDAATFKAAMSGVMLYYELATPVETPISETDLTAYRTLHTNKPNTTVYTDSNAGLTVEYAADPKIYIDNKFTELATAIVNNA